MGLVTSNAQHTQRAAPIPNLNFSVPARALRDLAAAAAQPGGAERLAPALRRLDLMDHSLLVR